MSQLNRLPQKNPKETIDFFFHFFFRRETEVYIAYCTPTNLFVVHNVIHTLHTCVLHKKITKDMF